MEWFSSVEFYIVAITIAIGIVGFMFSSSPPNEILSCLYTAQIRNSRTDEDTEDEDLIIKTLETGETEICHIGAKLPLDALVILKVSMNGEKIKCEEYIEDNGYGGEITTCDLVYKVTCIKRGKSYIRFECNFNGKWGTTSYLKTNGFTNKITLRN